MLCTLKLSVACYRTYFHQKRACIDRSIRYTAAEKRADDLEIEELAVLNSFLLPQHWPDLEVRKVTQKHQMDRKLETIRMFIPIKYADKFPKAIGQNHEKAFW